VEHRALWVAVVMQARADIESEDRDGYDYAQAVAFFTGSGDWARSRQSIADCLELHPDDLMRLGKAAIAARCLRDGDAPVMVDAAGSASECAMGLRSRPASPIPRPEPLAMPVPAEPMVLSEAFNMEPDSRHIKSPIAVKKRGRPRKPVVPHDRNWWISRFLEKQAA
jgi:hypothetical protein